MDETSLLDGVSVRLFRSVAPLLLLRIEKPVRLLNYARYVVRRVL